MRYNNITIKTKSQGGLGLIEGRYKANKDAALYLNIHKLPLFFKGRRCLK